MSYRVQITLTDEQYERLRNESARSGLGVAALVRRAIGGSYGTSAQRQLVNALDNSFGAWTDHESRADDVDALRRKVGRRLTDE